MKRIALLLSFYPVTDAVSSRETVKLDMWENGVGGFENDRIPLAA